MARHGRGRPLPPLHGGALGRGGGGGPAAQAGPRPPLRQHPRVHFEADYRARLWFGETVRTELKVTKVGASSLHYAFTVHGEGEEPAATGRMVIAHSAARASGSTAWPDDVREVLAKAGPQAPELFA